MEKEKKYDIKSKKNHNNTLSAMKWNYKIVKKT